MIHAFLLFVYIGLGEEKRLVSKDMFFKDLNDCIWYAEKLNKQKSSITAYCLPQQINKDSKVY